MRLGFPARFLFPFNSSQPMVHHATTRTRRPMLHQKSPKGGCLIMTDLGLVMHFSTERFEGLHETSPAVLPYPASPIVFCP